MSHWTHNKVWCLPEDESIFFQFPENITIFSQKYLTANLNFQNILIEYTTVLVTFLMKISNCCNIAVLYSFIWLLLALLKAKQKIQLYKQELYSMFSETESPFLTNIMWDTYSLCQINLYWEKKCSMIKHVLTKSVAI